MFIFAPEAYAEAKENGVVRCSNKTSRCVAKIPEGYRGQKIQVLDETARQAGSGVILKRRGDYVLIKVTQFSKKIRKNFPVVLMPHDYCYTSPIK